MMPSIAAIPNSATKPIAAETLNAVPVITKCKDTAHQGHGDHAGGEQRVGERAEIDVKQKPISRIESGTIRARRWIASCELAELAHPFQAVAGRQLHLLRDLMLRIGHRAAQVAPAHREFDGDVAFLVLAIDEGRA